MLDRSTTMADVRPATSSADMVDAVRAMCAKQLSPLIRKIDGEGFYPEAVMRELGRLGAFARHLPGAGASAGIDLNGAIGAMAAAGEHCLSTSFCVWCQDAFAWYIFASANHDLKNNLGRQAASGEALGGTALSNPMKTFFGIEQMRLKGKRADGGYVVKGLLPYVSNLGSDHYFGGIFEAEDGGGKRNVMAIFPCAADGLDLADSTKFVALDGTRTFSVQMRDVFVPDSWILADPADEYVKRIRAGFVLLQAGMAFGLIRDCIKLMQRTRGPLGHVNKYLEVQPEDLAERLAAMEAEVAQLAITPFESDISYWRAVIEARLAAGEASVAAAHAAMLHCGARGYVANATAQRRLREAYFVAIVTPATKQLKKMLADMAH